jgi:hypothetical protein
MGKKNAENNKARQKEEKLGKDVCCEKFLKKGKHCKDCPLARECRLPGRVGQG